MENRVSQFKVYKDVVKFIVLAKVVLMEAIDINSFVLGLASGAALTIVLRFTLSFVKSERNSVVQKGVNAGGDVVAGSKNVKKTHDQ